MEESCEQTILRLKRRVASLEKAVADQPTVPRTRRRRRVQGPAQPTPGAWGKGDKIATGAPTYPEANVRLFGAGDTLEWRKWARTHPEEAKAVKEQEEEKRKTIKNTRYIGIIPYSFNILTQNFYFLLQCVPLPGDPSVRYWSDFGDKYISKPAGWFFGPNQRDIDHPPEQKTLIDAFAGGMVPFTTAFLRSEEPILHTVNDQVDVFIKRKKWPKETQLTSSDGRYTILMAEVTRDLTSIAEKKWTITDKEKKQIKWWNWRDLMSNKKATKHWSASRGGGGGFVGLQWTKTWKNPSQSLEVCAQCSDECVSEIYSSEMLMKMNSFFETTFQKKRQEFFKERQEFEVRLSNPSVSEREFLTSLCKIYRAFIALPTDFQTKVELLNCLNLKTLLMQVEYFAHGVPTSMVATERGKLWNFIDVVKGGSFFSLVELNEILSMLRNAKKDHDEKVFEVKLQFRDFLLPDIAPFQGINPYTDYESFWKILYGEMPTKTQQDRNAKAILYDKLKIIWQLTQSLHNNPPPLPPQQVGIAPRSPKKMLVDIYNYYIERKIATGFSILKHNLSLSPLQLKFALREENERATITVDELNEKLLAQSYWLDPPPPMIRYPLLKKLLEE